MTGVSVTEAEARQLDLFSAFGRALSDVLADIKVERMALAKRVGPRSKQANGFPALAVRWAAVADAYVEFNSDPDTRCALYDEAVRLAATAQHWAELLKDGRDE